MLVLGDSVVWGQGLLSENKFWHITKEWLSEYLGGDVKEHIEAHSGATIKLRHAGRFPVDRAQTYNQEINISSPTISLQAEHAIAHYSLNNVRLEDVGLILVNGGINDVAAKSLVNPLTNDKKLKSNIRKYCGRDMSELLGMLSRSFPNARIVVTGYYPLVTAETNRDILCDLVDSAFRSVYDGPFEFLISRFITGKLCNSKLGIAAYLEMIKQSKIWWDDSTLHLKQSVDRTNSDRPFHLKGPRAIFVPAPFEPQNAYGTPESYLWMVREKTLDETKAERIEEDGLPVNERAELFRFITQDPKETPQKPFDHVDPLYKVRRNSICRCSHIKLNGINHGICTVAATGHPNVRGAQAYAEAIKRELAKIPRAEWHLAV